MGNWKTERISCTVESIETCFGLSFDNKADEDVQPVQAAVPLGYVFLHHLTSLVDDKQLGYFLDNHSNVDALCRLICLLLYDSHQTILDLDLGQLVKWLFFALKALELLRPEPLSLSPF